MQNYSPLFATHLQEKNKKHYSFQLSYDNMTCLLTLAHANGNMINIFTASDEFESELCNTLRILYKL